MNLSGWQRVLWHRKRTISPRRYTLIQWTHAALIRLTRVGIKKERRRNGIFNATLIFCSCSSSSSAAAAAAAAVVRLSVCLVAPLFASARNHNRHPVHFSTSSLEGHGKKKNRNWTGQGRRERKDQISGREV